MENKKLSNLKLYLFDMDGTLYLGNRLFDFTNELLAAIKASGGRYMFMTNNSSKSVEDYIKKGFQHRKNARLIRSHFVLLS